MHSNIYKQPNFRAWLTGPLGGGGEGGGQRELRTQFMIFQTKLQIWYCQMFCKKRLLCQECILQYRGQREVTSHVWNR